MDENSDVLANFKRNAGRTGADVMTVWAIYFGKHLDSIETFIREWAAATSDKDRRKLVERGEGIISRFDDARNYLDLGECILHELGYHPGAEKVLIDMRPVGDLIIELPADCDHRDTEAVDGIIWCNGCGVKVSR